MVCNSFFPIGLQRCFSKGNVFLFEKMFLQWAKCLFYVDKHCLLRYVFRSIAAWAFFCLVAAEGFFLLSRRIGLLAALWFLLNRRKGLSLCSRSSREGFSFLLPEQKKRNKENSPSALFCLLRHFSPLNKKNSLRSNSFLFFTLRKAPPLHGKKVRPDLTAFTQHRFACWVVMFSLASLVLFCHPERSKA